MPQSQSSKMFLYVPTRGRVGRQFTLRNLPQKWLERTTVVCPHEEAKSHFKEFPGISVLPQPDKDMTIAAKRAWIFEQADLEDQEKIMMLDDDLRFSTRVKTLKQFAGYAPEGSRGSGGNSAWAKVFKAQPGIHKVVSVSGNDPRLVKTFDRIEEMLDDYPHGGINTRLHNQEYGCEFTCNSRVQYALAFHVPTVLKCCELGRINTREDFDYTLQLLRRGFDNAVYVWTVVEQNAYGDKGGASGERKISASNADAYKLARLHPGYVKAAKRNYKDSIPRVEVTVRWKDAVEDGKNEFLKLR